MRTRFNQHSLKIPLDTPENILYTKGKVVYVYTHTQYTYTIVYTQLWKVCIYRDTHYIRG